MERKINEIIIKAMEIEAEYFENLAEATRKADTASNELKKVERDSHSTEYEIDEAYDNLCEAEEAESVAEEKHDDILEALDYLRRVSEMFNGLGL